MKNVPLKWRLTSIGLIPLLAYLVIAGFGMYENFENIKYSGRLEGQLKIVELSSLAVHELQKERGQSASLLSGAAVEGKLAKQRAKAQERIEALRAELEKAPFEAVYVQELRQAIDSVEGFRKNVDARVFGVPDAVKNYTGVIFRLLQVGKDVSNWTRFANVATELRSLSILESAKENGGKLRAVVSGVLAKNKPIGKKKVEKILKLQGGLYANLKSSGLALQSKDQETINDLLQSEKWKTVEATVLHVVKNSEGGDYFRDSSAFFALISSRLDVVGGVLGGERVRIQDSVHKIAEMNWREMITSASILLGFTSFLVFLLWRSVSGLNRQLSQITEDLFLSTSKLTKSATEAQSSSYSLSQSAVQQSASLQETVASADEISAMVSRNASNASLSSEKSQQSKSSVDLAQASVDKMLKAIQEISHSNKDMVKELSDSNNEISEIVKVIREIGDKTNVINDIVFQTKLLSFNASVEAARAGEHGKGFAVVAEEVGNLATMSGTAANEISDMLNNSIKQVEAIVSKTQGKVQNLSTTSTQKVEAGLDRAQDCKSALDTISSSVGEVDQLVGEISEASSEQDLGLKEIANAMSELDKVTQENTKDSREVAGISQSIESHTQSLDSLVSGLKGILLGKSSQDESWKNVSQEPAAEPTSQSSAEQGATASEDDDPSNVLPFPKPEDVLDGVQESSMQKVVGGDEFPDWDDPGFEEV